MSTCGETFTYLAMSRSAICAADILAAWHIDPRDAAYVGDADTDMREAELAGVIPLGAQWSTRSTIHLMAKMPELTFTSIPDFLYWLHANLS